MVEVMSNPVEYICSRASQSEARLLRLTKKVSKKIEMPNGENLCVYITGSFGRAEASKFSDLDIFFLHNGSEKSSGISNIDKSLLDASVIKVCREEGFPEFSGGGKFLQIHYLDDILGTIGSREDDYKNYFTARLLLLLESKPLVNGAVYLNAVDKIISSYFKDYHGHEKNFTPNFIVNDILRFWRTLCLNYEHKRHLRGSDTIEAKRKSYIENFKLKFSRLMTCFSALCSIIDVDGSIDSDGLKGVFSKTPTERLIELSDSRIDLRSEVSSILEHYAWFLKMTGKPQQDQLDWIGDKERRNSAFDRAREFGNEMYNLIIKIPRDNQKLRYLVI